MIVITTTWHNAGSHTIYGQLEKRLGRKPTDKEAADEVTRILREVSAGKGTRAG